MTDCGLGLEQPVGAAVRDQAEAQLRAARMAYAALRKGDDPEALHDLRVALRRLRSLLRAYRGNLSVRKRARRELRELTEATNPARDAEVLLALYSAVPQSRSPRLRPGIAWAGQRLRTEYDAGAAAAETALKANFERLCRHLEQTLVARGGDDAQPWRVVLGAKLAEAWAALEARLHDLGQEFTVERAHRARIEAKRLRYLCEPACRWSVPATELVKQLKYAQTALGELRDAQLFGVWLLHAAEAVGAERAREQLERTLAGDGEPGDSEPDAVPGLVHLARFLHAREQTLASQVMAWLAGGGDRLLSERVAALRAAL